MQPTLPLMPDKSQTRMQQSLPLTITTSQVLTTKRYKQLAYLSKRYSLVTIVSPGKRLGQHKSSELMS